MVTLLASIGYEPAINLNSLTEKKDEKKNNRFYYQLGIAGFSFGNIMLISFPEYFGLDAFSKAYLSPLFGYLNLTLALPVFFYSAQDYFISAYKSLKAKTINIDFPLALGILVMFVRSSYEIIMHTGLGFFDTLAGLVFLLLVGKWAQQYTINKYAFERDYKSYFPVAVTLLENDFKETTIAVNKLKPGNRIAIHNNEIIPADAILLKGNAKIDFSFVTGENEPVEKVLGEVIYAGGRQTAGKIELEVIKPADQSYLTELWNSEQYKKALTTRFTGFQTKVSKLFTAVLLAIAFSCGFFWLIYDYSKALNAFTAVLIIACPCALALSSPFALGNAMRMLGRSGFYVKSAQVIEKLASVNTIIFDKTGTITQPGEGDISFIGSILTKTQKEMIYAICRNSMHPLSKKITKYYINYHNKLQVHNYNEQPGKGISAIINNTNILLGSAKYLNLLSPIKNNNKTEVHLIINQLYMGYFKITHRYRDNLDKVIQQFKSKYSVYLLSGDNEKERENLNCYFNNNMFFNQLPADKMLFINNLKNQKHNVLMIGDGLNDSGAIKVADVGISVTENTANFTPASDVILDAKMFDKLPLFINYGKQTLQIIKANFIISLIYNLVGLYFAVQGNLSPLFAAIIMPISSISVILITSSLTYLVAKKFNII